MPTLRIMIKINSIHYFVFANKLLVNVSQQQQLDFEPG